MTRTVVAFDAIHGSPDTALLRGLPVTILGNHTIAIGEFNLVNFLARLIGAVANCDARIDVPVNSGRAHTSGTTNTQQQCRSQFGIYLVLIVMLSHRQLVTHKLRWPVTLLTGISRRAQIMQWRWNGSRINIQRHSNQLQGTIHFGLNEPVRAWTDMALRAPNA